ncbi:5'-methylthioadenosine/S-adenosylhomocysteine nucleosidase [Sutcliffiella horikoshii]|uniref:5'-methylthioadenosine/S-adenosylhomocysteine nucleosidase n=1 Tax=Sutcliffiella horikoshii TaxID=79883 RepID=UPI001EEE6ACB|nr:5'-methylthioadenosine/S-adenosylhomocysteine nucleosidase [Sutcliffiella horikoshii]MCG1022282.1 5'-methylthioadenosine/S-adenosylhomocysteine nucleosidase [Sutcliffiella horikoshii]
MKVAIIGAMEEEVTIMREKIEDMETTTVAGCEYYTGTLNGVDVILSKSGIGKVNAALSTSLLLERFKPEVVINTGSAGGFSPSLNVGDVVISTEVRHHDVDVTAFGYEYGQVPGLPAAFEADAKLMAVAKKAAENVSGMQVVEGLIATGDSFMNDPVRVEAVREKMPELQAAEMEAAAIAQVCHAFEVPFVVIRALSDIAGKESNISFDQFLSKAALHSSMLIENMLSELKNA